MSHIECILNDVESVIKGGREICRQGRADLIIVSYQNSNDQMLRLSKFENTEITLNMLER